MVRDHDNKDAVAEADEAHDTAGSDGAVAGAQTAGGNLGQRCPGYVWRRRPRPQAF